MGPSSLEVPFVLNIRHHFSPGCSCLLLLWLLADCSVLLPYAVLDHSLCPPPNLLSTETSQQNPQSLPASQLWLVVSCHLLPVQLEEGPLVSPIPRKECNKQEVQLPHSSREGCLC